MNGRDVYRNWSARLKRQTVEVQKVREIIGKLKFNINIAIKKREGTIALGVEDAKTRWNQYIRGLFRDQRPHTYGSQIKAEGAVILKEEVTVAMKKLKTGKAVGSDGIDIDMLDALGEFTLGELT